MEIVIDAKGVEDKCSRCGWHGFDWRRWFDGERVCFACRTDEEKLALAIFIACLPKDSQ